MHRGGPFLAHYDIFEFPAAAAITALNGCQSSKRGGALRTPISVRDEIKSSEKISILSQFKIFMENWCCVADLSILNKSG